MNKFVFIHSVRLPAEEILLRRKRFLSNKETMVEAGTTFWSREVAIGIGKT